MLLADRAKLRYFYRIGSPSPQPGIRELPNFIADQNLREVSILFHDTVFGPVSSRRLGVSLGINLLPSSFKFCTFNCIYCECGWSRQHNIEREKLPGMDEVLRKLEERLSGIHAEGGHIDAITFAGNGEPTIHPQFPAILESTLILRDRFFPEAAVTVLSNASTLDRPEVFDALLKADKNILKLDAGSEETFRLINGPDPGITLRGIVDKMKLFGGKVIIQTLFLRGNVGEKTVDNTQESELVPWIALLKEINPEYVMLYPVDRSTPLEGIEKIGFAELVSIAERLEKEGLKAQVYS